MTVLDTAAARISSSPSPAGSASALWAMSLSRLFPVEPPRGISQLARKAAMRVASSSEIVPVSCIDRRRTEAALDSVGFCRARKRAELLSSAPPAASGDIAAVAGAGPSIISFITLFEIVLCYIQ